MATNRAHHYTLLDDLDARQNEVLAELDLLNQRVVQLLDQFTRRSTSASPAQTAVPESEGAATSLHREEASSQERAA